MHPDPTPTPHVKEIHTQREGEKRLRRLYIKYPLIGWEVGWCWGGRLYSVHPQHFLLQAFGQIFKEDVIGFFSTSEICFMPPFPLNISWSTAVEESCSVRNPLWQPISQKWGPIQSCTQKRENGLNRNSPQLRHFFDESKSCLSGWDKQQ